VEKGGVYTFLQMDGLIGKVVESEEFHVDDIAKAFTVSGFVDAEGRRSVVVVTEKGQTKALPSTVDTHSISAKMSEKLFYFVDESKALQGYTFDSVCS